MNIYIVIPTYNEAENIERLFEQIFSCHPDFNIIVVDDNSPDGTGQIADTIASRDRRVNVIHRPKKAGLGTAYVRGFQEALARGADLVFEMDADLSHGVGYLKDFLTAINKADVVIGSRYKDGVRVEGWRFRRLLLSKLANMYVSYIMVKPVWDFTAGFRCYRRQVLETINLEKVRSDGYAFQIEMTYLAFKHGFRVVEIPIIFKERDRGSSKISRNVVWEAIWLTLRCRAPLIEVIKHLPFLFKDYREWVESYQEKADF
ncbi:MAG: polyprenol monophosphomannose synthase [Syntrophotaleaceae bacterium]